MVVQWISTVEGGRFSKIALPRDVTGAKLLQVSERKLCQLFSGDLRGARGDGETGAWVIDSEVGEVLGKALYQSLRSEQVMIRKRQLTAQGKAVSKDPRYN
jgi:hypothetical protein